MKILFIIPSLSGGGAEKIIGYLSKEFSKIKGNKVYIVTLNEKSEDYDYGGELIYIKYPLIKYKFLSKVFKLFYCIYFLKKFKRNKEIEVSISFLPISDILNYFSKNKEKLIMSIRNNLIKKYEENGYLLKKIHLYCLKNADKIVALSSGIKKSLICNYNFIPNNIFVIYNFIEKDYILMKASEECEISLNEDNIILNIGRMTKQKGQWHLIKAAKILKDKNYKFKIIILGKGELKEKLIDLSQKMNVEKKVMFIDFTSNPYPIIKASDIFVFSSLYEGLGNSILEAGILEKPVISTDCLYGPREILSLEKDYKTVIKKISLEKYGILLQRIENQEENFSLDLESFDYILAEAIEKLINNKELKIKYSKSINERMKEFNKEKIVTQWIDLIKDN
ncbi:MAG: glycosyltransferase [Cetobacterium sp.]